MKKKDYFRNIDFQERKLVCGVKNLACFSIVKKALLVIKKAHKGQKRNEGDDYVIHLLRVANILICNFKIKESEFIIAGLLHDIVEDTKVSLVQIRIDFGENVAKLVLALTRVKSKETKIAKARRIIDSKLKNLIILNACDLLDNARSLVFRSDRGLRWKRHLRELKEIAIPFTRTIKNKWLDREMEKSYNQALKCKPFKR